MSIRIILAPLVGTPVDAVALAAAHTVAGRFDAQVDCLFVHPDPRETVLRLGDEGASVEVINQLRRAIEAGDLRCGVAKNHFDAACAAVRAAVAERASASGPSPMQWREVREVHAVAGEHEPALVRAGRLADLIVFGRVNSGRDPRLALEAVLLGSGRPLLLAPPGPPPASIGAAAAIAWNASAAAARAVSAAMPFLELAGAVHVLTAETPRTRAAAAAELVEYLRRHGIEGEVRPIRAGAGPVGPALLETATRVGADLLVMGGYGHSRLRELILGGVTRHVVAHAELPVLLAH